MRVFIARFLRHTEQQVFATPRADTVEEGSANTDDMPADCNMAKDTAHRRYEH